MAYLGGAEDEELATEGFTRRNIMVEASLFIVGCYSDTTGHNRIQPMSR